jgi:taurine dioxygenase
MVFSTRPLAPFGVEVEADLSRPLSARQVAQLRQLVDAHGVILARNQRLTINEQRAVMAHFGKIPDRDLIYVALDDGVLNADGMGYHSDFSFAHTPYKYLSLHALELDGPPTSTRFANGALAYQRLTDDQRKTLARLTTIAVSTATAPRAYQGDIRDDVFTAVRSAVIYHPRTEQPILYLTESQHARFNELSREDGDALFKELFDVLYAPGTTLEHVWSVGDILIFDNLMLQHGRPYAGKMSRRVLQRVSIADVPAHDMLPEFLDESGLPQVTEA